MGVGAGLYMYVVVVQKFTFAISSPDEFLFIVLAIVNKCEYGFRLCCHFCFMPIDCMHSTMPARRCAIARGPIDALWETKCWQLLH